MVLPFLKKLALLGCQNISDYRLLRTVFLINIINLIALIALCLVIMVYTLTNNFAYIPSGLPFFLILSGPLYLNSKRRYKISKVVFLITMNLSILFGTFMLGYAVGVSFFYLSTLAMTYIIYTSRELRAMIAFTLMTIALFLFVDIFQAEYFTGFVPFEAGQRQPIRILMNTLNICTLATACYSMHVIIDKLHYMLLKEEEGKIEQTKLAALSVMSAGIAHEINNPLAIICSRVEQIAYYLNQPQINRDRLLQMLANVLKNADRIGKIVKSLRSLARRSSHDNYDPFPLSEIIADSLELCREKMNRHKIVLHYNPPPQKTMVPCRPSEIMQVLINLINNAVDATMGLQDRWIRIVIENSAKYVTIRIIDSGAGIPRDIRSRIMEPFFTTKEVGRGTGIGLSISATIVQNHGGKLILDHRHSHTCFLVILPRALV